MSRAHRRWLRALVVTAAAHVLAPSASAQVQVAPFQPPAPWFGGLLSGVLRGPNTHPQVGPIGASQVAVDQTGDGLVDALYDLPAAIQNDTQSPSRWILEDRLSPTQQVLYTRRAPRTGASPPVCGGDVNHHEVFFHRLDTPPSMTLLGSACLRGPLARQPAFFDPSRTASLRTAAVVAAPGAGQQEVAWFDLAGGGAGEDAATYEPNVSVTAEGVQVSPFGNAFFIRHRTGQAGLPARYSIVDLCADRSGGAVSTATEPVGATGLQVRHRIENGGLFADVSFASPAETRTFVLSDCFGGTPPPLRRLTVAVNGNGGVVSNPPGIACDASGQSCAADFVDGTLVGLTAVPFGAGVVFRGWSGDCSGTAAGTQVLVDADRACTATFGSVQLAVSKSADRASIPAGDTLTYTLDYANNGTAGATGVILTDTLPAGSSFVSASAGGTLSGATVSWSIGALAAGASGQVQLRLTPACSVSQLVNAQYSIDADAVFPVSGAAVTTAVAAPPRSPVTVQIVSVPDRSPPLRRGDRITHTIMLTNAGPDDHGFLRLVTSLGDAVSLDALIDAGTGAFDFRPPTTLEWTGPLAAGASTSLVLRTIVDDCFSTTRTSLNSGAPVVVFNACSEQVGSGTPPAAFPLQRPLSARVTADVPASRVTVTTLPAGLELIAVRPGETIDLRMTVTNNFPTDEPAVSASTVLPAGLTPAGDPPFVPPTDPGAAWDPLTRTVSWSGTLGASATVTLTFRATVDAPAPCRIVWNMRSSSGTCPAIQTGSLLHPVPVPPASPYLLALDELDGLFTWEPGVDRNYREALCVHTGEGWLGLGRTPSGDAWIAGLPSFHANLDPMALQALDEAFLDSPTVQADTEFDVAHDPTDGTLVFVGNGGVRRYDPRTGGVVNVSALRGGAIQVEPDGTIVLAGGAIVRIDPADPGNPQTLADPAYGVGPFDREADGDYVALAVRVPGTVEALVEIDAATGTFTPIVSDLAAATGNTVSRHGPIAVAPDGTVYVGRFDGLDVYAIDRSGPTPIVTSLSATGTVLNGRTTGIFHDRVRDFVFVGGAPPAPQADLALAMVASPDPVAPGGLLSYTVTARNLGPDAASGAVVGDTLPAGVAFDASASSPACTESAGVVTCPVGDLAAGQSAVLTVAVTVDPSATGTLSNTATLAGATADPDPGNNAATAAVSISPPPPPQADLALSKTASPDPLVVGQDLAYTLAVTNGGPDAATGVAVTDALPALLDFDPAASDAACTLIAGTVTCGLGTLAPGARLAATVGTVPRLSADLAVGVDATAQPVTVGGSLVYTIDVANHGPGDARDVHVRTLASAFDAAGLPAGPPLDVAIVAVHPSRGGCVGSGPGGGPPLDCALGTLLPGENARVAVVVRPNAATTAIGTAGPPLRNAARVLTPGRDLDPYPANDEATADAVVLPAGGPDLAIVRAGVAPDGPVAAGTTLTYTLELTNLGDQPAPDALLYTLAAGFGPDGQPVGAPLDVTLVAMTASQGTCADLGGGSGPVRCALGTLPPGGQVVVEVTATAGAASVSPPLRSRSRVTTAGAIAGTPVDPHPGNDETTTATVVLPASGADLGVTRLQVTPATPIVQGADLTYSLEVTNFGPDAAPDVVLHTLTAAFDALGRPQGPPLDVALVTVVPSQGTCMDTGGAGRGPVACTLGTLAPGATALVNMVVKPESATVALGAPDDPIVNAAAVTTEAALAGSDLDPNPANDQRAVESTVLERLPDTIDNVATVASAVADPDGANDVAATATRLISAVVPPPPSADLGVDVSGPAQAALGVPGMYTATITNAGPGTAAGASVLLQVSQGLTLASAGPSQGTCAGGPAVLCALGDLAGGATATVALVLTPRFSGTQSLAAHVSASGSVDPDPTDDDVHRAIRVLAPAGADLAVSQSASVDPAVAGAPLEYRVTVVNLGPEAAVAVRLVDVLPGDVAPGSATPSQGTCTMPDDVVCALGDLPPGAEATVVVAVTVRPTTPEGTVLTNTATATGATTDPAPANDTASLDTPVVARADLVLVKTAPSTPVRVGDPVRYVLTALNRGPSHAAQVTVVDPLPAGFSFEPAGSTVGCAASAGTVTCALGDLAPGETAQAVVVAVATQPGTAINTASVSSAATDPAAGDNSSSATTEIVPASGENVDPSNLGEQYAYGENAGWVNLEPLGDGGPGVEVASSGLSGWMWGENIGWCSLSCADTGSCAGVAYGVTNDGSGTLAGFAWCENAGWLSFSCANTASCGSAAYGVTIDPATGLFSGEAWFENLGWIRFGSSGAPYAVVTAWRAAANP